MKDPSVKEYVVLPPAELGDKKKSKAWVERSLAFVMGIPTKGPGQKVIKGARK